MGEEVGLAHRSQLAAIGIKWNLAHEEVTTVVVGTNNPGHLIKNLEVIDNLELNDEENQIIEKIRSSSFYTAYEERKTKAFFKQS